MTTNPYNYDYIKKKRKGVAKTLYLVNRAVSKGKLKPVNSYLCPCGKVADVYHHIDYSMPYLLIPLCIKCHQIIHGKLRKQKSTNSILVVDY